MALDLKLSACINNCKELLIYDNTLRQSDTVPNGWGGMNPYPDESYSAILKITYPDLTEETIELDIQSLPSSVSSSFILHTVNLTGIGKYKIEYIVTTATDFNDSSTDFVTSTCLEIFNLCTLRCCVDKLWVKVYDTSCSCLTTHLKTALEAEALYKAIQHATGSLKIETRDILIKKLERICKLAECNCK